MEGRLWIALILIKTFITRNQRLWHGYGNISIRFIFIIHKDLKSDNLQYNTLVCWLAGTNDSFQVLFISQFIAKFFA